jgi:arylsulfate sulfotransferase
VHLQNSKALAAFFLLLVVGFTGCESGPLKSSSTATPDLDIPLAAGQAINGAVATTQNPLVARYTIETAASGNVSVDFGTDKTYGMNTWDQVPSTQDANGFQTSILVAGMRASTTYHLRAKITLPDGTVKTDTDRTFTTGAVPAGRVPNVKVTQPAGMVPNPGIELFDVVNLTSVPQTSPIGVAAFDLSGNVIWYYDMQDGTQLDSAFPVKMLPNGNFLLVVNGGFDGVREIDLAGDTVSQFTITDVENALIQAGTPLALNSLHHDILPLSNGHLILLVNMVQTYTNLQGLPGTTAVTGDVLIDLDENRNVAWLWKTFDHLDLNRRPLSFPDWTHSNAIIYSPSDGNLILSMRDQDWVIKIDYQDGAGSGDILWRLGPGGDFTIPGGGPADSNYAQHYPILLSSQSSGSYPLMLFDNGNNRILDTKGTICGSPGALACYSRPVIFQLDETAKTAQIKWQYKLPYFSSCCGSIQVLGNNDVEYDIALFSVNPFASRVQEVTQDPTNPQLVWQMDEVGQLAYRFFRIPSLYPGVEWKTLP